MSEFPQEWWADVIDRLARIETQLTASAGLRVDIDAVEGRVDKLEGWRSRLLGGLAVVSAAIGWGWLPKP